VPEIAADQSMNSRTSPSPARVAICTVGELFGGVERHVLTLLDALRSRGIEPCVFVFHEGELAMQARASGVAVEVLPSRNAALFASARRLATQLARCNVHVVHVHGYKAAVACALARLRYRFAVVKTEHGLPERMDSRPLQGVRERAYRLIDAIACRASQATVVYVTHELCSHYRFVHAGLKHEVIPNGISPPERSALGCPDALAKPGFHVVIAGRLDSVKGHGAAIAALASPALARDVHLHVLGTGPLERALRDQAAEHGLADRVHFHGFRRDVYGWFAHCDVVVMPSLHEGLPYTLLEAMAMGCTIVASRVGGLAEVLDSNCALLVAPGDVPALGTALARLRDDAALGARLGTAAQQLQATRYSLAAMVDRYVRAYADARTRTS